MNPLENQLNRLKRAAKREVQEARGQLWEGIKQGVAAAAPVAGQLLRGDYAEALPGPSPAERHRALVEEGASTRHTLRLRKTPKVNR